MTNTTITNVAPAAAGTAAVAARFLMANHDEIVVNGTIITITNVIVSTSVMPGTTLVDGLDVEDRAVTLLIPSEQMVELYDRTAADAILAETLASLVTA